MDTSDVILLIILVSITVILITGIVVYFIYITKQDIKNKKEYEEKLKLQDQQDTLEYKLDNFITMREQERKKKKWVIV